MGRLRAKAKTTVDGKGKFNCYVNIRTSGDAFEEYLQIISTIVSLKNATVKKLEDEKNKISLDNFGTITELFEQLAEDVTEFSKVVRTSFEQRKYIMESK